MFLGGEEKVAKSVNGIDEMSESDEDEESLEDEDEEEAPSEGILLSPTSIIVQMSAL